MRYEIIKVEVFTNRKMDYGSKIKSTGRARSGVMLMLSIEEIRRWSEFDAKII